MPIPTKWKLVAGTVTAVVGVSTAAAALTGSEPEELELDDVVAVTQVASVPSLEFSVAAAVDAPDADDSYGSPFDNEDESPEDSPDDSVDHSVDTDGDGITDVAEMTLGTNPKIADTDGDGFSDYEEVALYGTEPTDPDDKPIPPQDEESPASVDSPDSPDSDDSSDSSDSDDSPDSPDTPDSPDSVDTPEIHFLDSDGDGLTDVAEAALQTDPKDADTDDDGLSDGEEVLHYGTDPIKEDSDGDGYTDGDEVDASTDPLDSTDFPGLDESAESTD